MSEGKGNTIIAIVLVAVIIGAFYLWYTGGSLGSLGGGAQYQSASGITSIGGGGGGGKKSETDYGGFILPGALGLGGLGLGGYYYKKKKEADAAKEQALYNAIWGIKREKFMSIVSDPNFSSTLANPNSPDAKQIKQIAQGVRKFLDNEEKKKQFFNLMRNNAVLEARFTDNFEKVYEALKKKKWLSWLGGDWRTVLAHAHHPAETEQRLHKIFDDVNELGFIGDLLLDGNARLAIINCINAVKTYKPAANIENQLRELIIKIKIEKMFSFLTDDRLRNTYPRLPAGHQQLAQAVKTYIGTGTAEEQYQKKLGLFTCLRSNPDAERPLNANIEAIYNALKSPYLLDSQAELLLEYEKKTDRFADDIHLILDTVRVDWNNHTYNSESEFLIALLSDEEFIRQIYRCMGQQPPARQLPVQQILNLLSQIQATLQQILQQPAAQPQQIQQTTQQILQQTQTLTQQIQQAAAQPQQIQQTIHPMLQQTQTLTQQIQQLPAAQVGAIQEKLKKVKEELLNPQDWQEISTMQPEEILNLLHDKLKILLDTLREMSQLPTRPETPEIPKDLEGEAAGYWLKVVLKTSDVEYDVKKYGTVYYDIDETGLVYLGNPNKIITLHVHHPSGEEIPAKVGAHTEVYVLVQKTREGIQDNILGVPLQNCEVWLHNKKTGKRHKAECEKVEDKDILRLKNQKKPIPAFRIKLQPEDGVVEYEVEINKIRRHAIRPVGFKISWWIPKGGTLKDLKQPSPAMLTAGETILMLPSGDELKIPMPKDWKKPAEGYWLLINAKIGKTWYRIEEDKTYWGEKTIDYIPAEVGARAEVYAIVLGPEGVASHIKGRPLSDCALQIHEKAYATNKEVERTGENTQIQTKSRGSIRKDPAFRINLRPQEGMAEYKVALKINKVTIEPVKFKMLWTRKSLSIPDYAKSPAPIPSLVENQAQADYTPEGHYLELFAARQPNKLYQIVDGKILETDRIMKGETEKERIELPEEETLVLYARPKDKNGKIVNMLQGKHTKRASVKFHMVGGLTRDGKYKEEKAGGAFALKIRVRKGETRYYATFSFLTYKMRSAEIPVFGT